VSAPFIRHNLSVSDALARAGVKGGKVPQFNDSIQPVVILANMAQSYSGEPLEARGLGGRDGAANPPGVRGWARLSSRAPGGLVIESLQVFYMGGFAADPTVFVDIVPELPVPAATEAIVPIVQAGGALTNAEMAVGYTTSFTSGTGGIDLQEVGSKELLRIYVPGGSHLVVWSVQVALGGEWIRTRFLWREIPAPIALP